MNFLSQSFPVGRLFGVRIHIHLLFIFYLLWELVGAAKGGASAIADELIFFTMIFGIVLLHEFGHCVGARSVGGSAEDIMLWPLGGIAFGGAPMTPWAQFVTVAAGPLVNVLICLAVAALLIVSTGSPGVISLNPFAGPGLRHMTHAWQLYAWLVYRLSYYLFLFNMLPVFPMDGGQLLRAALWPSLGLHRATLISAQLGIVGAIGFAAWGLQRGQQIMVVIAIWGGLTAYQHYQAARAGLASDHFYSIDRSIEQAGRAHRRRGFWSRLWQRLRGPSPPRPGVNPNPGGWQRKLDDESSLERELDRILAKVHDHGLHSLTYVERQTLERATRERQRRERETYGRVD